MKKYVISIMLAAVFLFIFAGVTMAQKANFTGKWEMNQEKSDLGMLNPTGAEVTLTLTIEQKDLEFKIHTVVNTPMGVMEEKMTYTLDGKESKNIDAQGVEMVTVCKWENNTLICDSKGETAGGAQTVKEEYSLSEDKKTLNLILTIKNPMGEIKATIVCNKVSS